MREALRGTQKQGRGQLLLRRTEREVDCGEGVHREALAAVRHRSAPHLIPEIHDDGGENRDERGGGLRS